MTDTSQSNQASQQPGETTPFRYTAALADSIERSWQDRWAAEATFDADNPVGDLAGPEAA